MAQIKLDSRPYALLSGQGDWIKHPTITVVIEDKKIVEALDSENELRWSAGKGQHSCALDKRNDLVTWG